MVFARLVRNTNTPMKFSNPNFLSTRVRYNPVFQLSVFTPICVALQLEGRQNQRQRACYLLTQMLPVNFAKKVEVLQSNMRYEVCSGGRGDQINTGRSPP